MRNGFLLAAVAAAFALCATPARAAEPRLTIAAPATFNGRILEIPYTAGPGITHIGIELQAPGATSFEPYQPWGPVPTSGPGTLTVPLYVTPAAVIEGQWRIRVIAAGPGDAVLETVEATTQLDWVSEIWVSAPYFDPLMLGLTSGSKPLRIENGLWGPLRVKQVSLPAGSELTIVNDGCSGRTLYGREGCYVELTCTPNALDWHRATLLVDANAPTKEIYMLCNGLAVPEPDPLPAATPAPTPTATVAPAVEPELAFDASPSRTSTRLFGLRLENVKPGSTITVRCAKGCPVKTYTRRNAGGTISLSRFASRRLKAGTTIRITLAQPGRPARTVTLKIRAKRVPRVSGSL